MIRIMQGVMTRLVNMTVAIFHCSAFLVSIIRVSACIVFALQHGEEKMPAAYATITSVHAVSVAEVFDG